ncbi:MAG: 3-oxoacyl-ACP reductase FabG [Gammaproteobacteria bacterium]|nr:MAG: 3-oxoacyl-ACP reductase FabG [Gammaproteobacteria bacterium]
MDKVALVTGASRGIGKAILHTLAADGYVVVGTATTENGVKKIQEELNSKGYAGYALVLDVTQDDSIKSCLDSIKEKYSAPTILINNAGITKDNLLMRMKNDEWNDVINTNLSSMYRLSKACLRDMMKAKTGRIVNISSVVGSSGNAGQTNYAAAKAGIFGFSKSLAQEVGSRGITVNAIAPGFIETDMTDDLNEDQQKALMGKIPLGRMGNVKDIAEAVKFLVSDSAGYITGETLHINGGLYMA